MYVRSLAKYVLGSTVTGGREDDELEGFSGAIALARSLLGGRVALRNDQRVFILGSVAMKSARIPYDRRHRRFRSQTICFNVKSKPLSEIACHFLLVVRFKLCVGRIGMRLVRSSRIVDELS